MGSQKNQSHFKKVQQFDADYTEARFTQYESQRTGMRVVVVDRKGPKVYGYFPVATEIFDDSGAPHTLEHLVFMGSRKYPYKGVLDKIATRAYSDTNAWTDTHETVYSLSTAGWEGFAQILPIYLDHVVVPTLTDAACYTEVHHINEKGIDAGYVSMLFLNRSPLTQPVSSTLRCRAARTSRATSWTSPCAATSTPKATASATRPVA